MCLLGFIVAISDAKGEFLGRWDFQEKKETSLIVTDKIGPGLFSDGILEGKSGNKPDFVDFEGSRGLYFDYANNENIKITNTGEFNHNFTDGLTVEALIKPEHRNVDPVGQQYTILSKCHITSNSRSFWLYCAKLNQTMYPGKIQLIFSVSGDGIATTSVSTNIDLNVSVRIKGVFSPGSKLLLYLNDLQVASTTTALTSLYQGSANVRIGAREAGVPATQVNSFHGTIDNVIIAQGTTYYIDSINGSDANDGLSPLNAWKTIAKANGTNFSAGAMVLFKRGCLWREQLTIPSSGQVGKPITFGAYGTGNNPTIHGGSIFTNWNGPDVNGVYMKSYAGTIWFLFEDNNLIAHASSPACTDGNWNFSSNVIYYRPTNGIPADHIVECACRGYAIYNGGKSNLHFDALNLTLSQNGIKAAGNSASLANIVISGCSISKCKNGIWFEGRNGYDTSNIAIIDNKLTNCGESIFLGSDMSGPERTNCSIVKRNMIINGGISVNSEYWSNFDVGDTEGIGLQNFNDGIVMDNQIIGGCPFGGIVLWTNQASRSDNNILYGNYIKDLLAWGICPGGGTTDTTTNNFVTNNIIVGCGQGSDTFPGPYGGIRLNTHQYPSNMIYNNTLAGNDINIYLNAYPAHYIIKNNISVSPVICHIIKNQAGMNDNVLDYNLYYSDNGCLFRLYGTDCNFWGWKIATSQDASSFVADPLFVNEAGGDYHINLYSPAVNAGTDVGLTNDLDGDPVPLGSTPDIGMDEVQ